MAHLTCVGHSRAQITRLLDDYAASGVRNILALGGDPPDDGDDDGEFAYASELVELIRDHPGGFCVGVAAHPEVHPRSADRGSDRRHLADKLRDADFAVTQFFFDHTEYERLVEELAALGCARPVIPGVMPFVSVAGLRRMSAMNGTAIPEWLERRLEGAADADVPEIGIATATELCERLLGSGAPGLHLYTLNRSTSVRRIWEALGPVR
jgi:methylenetetrahydrofolate reductase (NADPH)